jgi:hypothetical protein
MPSLEKAKQKATKRKAQTLPDEDASELGMMPKAASVSGRFGSLSLSYLRLKV